MKRGNQMNPDSDFEEETVSCYFDLFDSGTNKKPLNVREILFGSEFFH